MSCLAVIMPAYNEEEVIAKVLMEWSRVLDDLSIEYEIHVYNDGSKDNTAVTVLAAARANSKIVLHDKANSGHGPTILSGYKENCDKFTWLFQTDSDNELPAEAFRQLWDAREKYDFLICRRDSRIQPLPRRLISLLSRLTVRTVYGKTVWDVNSPFRLMRSDKFKDLFFQIPEDTFAPNVVLSGLAGMKNLKFMEAEAPHTQRTTGQVSIKKWKLLKSALRSFFQTVTIRFKLD